MIDIDFGESVLKQEELLQMKKETGKVSVAGQVEMMTAIPVAILELKDEISNLKETLSCESPISTSGIEIEIEFGLKAIKESIDNGFALVAEAIKNSKGRQ